MKREAFILSIALCIVYFLICEWMSISKPEIQANQGLWSENVILAQKFLYETPDKNYNCILGSSLSSLFYSDSLPKNLQVLGLKGLGVYDGLNLLMLKKTLPDTIYIELNVLHRGPKPEFIEKMGSTPIELSLKKSLLFLQEKYIPAGLFVSVIEKSIRNKKHSAPAIFLRDSVLFNSKLLMHHNYYGSQLTKKEKFCIEKICKILKDLQKKNVKIIFFEMPVDCSLAQMKLPKEITNEVNKIFYSGTYYSLPVVDCNNYQTTDGIHLTTADGKKFSGVFRRYIDSL